VPALEARKTAPPDPLLIHAELPLRATYYPLGFTVNVITNSEEVLRAAEESWGLHERAFAGAPLELRIVVQDGAGSPPDPVFRGQGRWIAIVGDAANFAVCDCDALTGSCFAGAEAAARRGSFRWHYLEAMAYVLLTQRHVVPLHAACVARAGRGVLLCGGSGAGKSTLAFGCARAGWTYVSDDATMLLQGAEDPVAIGKPQQARFREDAPALFPELSRYEPQFRPNGKPSLEAPMSDFPGIETAARCRIERIVFIERQARGTGRVRPVAADTVMERLLAELAAYREEVRARHERSIATLRAVPAWEMRYSTLPEAIRMLRELM
jgi:hypothetical protein